MAAVEKLRLGRGLKRINNTASTSISDYMGSYLPRGRDIVFRPGPLYLALLHGHWFLADELNLADPATMAMLFPILEGAAEVAVPGTERPSIPVHPDFRFFATQNPANSHYRGRFDLPPTLRSRFLELTFGDFDAKELEQIIQRRRDPDPQWQDEHVPPAVAHRMAVVYERLARVRSEAITLRQIVKWGRRYLRLRRDAQISLDPGAEDALWMLSGWHLLESGTAWVPAQQRLLEAFKEADPTFRRPVNPPVITQEERGVRFAFDDVVARVQAPVGEALKVERTWVTEADAPPLNFQKALAAMALALYNHEPVLLIGPTSLKTRLINTWSRMNHREAERLVVYLTADTESGALLGDIRPMSLAELLRHIPTCVEHFSERYQRLPDNEASQRLFKQAGLLRQKMDPERQDNLRKLIADFIQELAAFVPHRAEPPPPDNIDEKKAPSDSKADATDGKAEATQHTPPPTSTELSAQLFSRIQLSSAAEDEQLQDDPEGWADESMAFDPADPLAALFGAGPDYASTEHMDVSVEGDSPLSDSDSFGHDGVSVTHSMASSVSHEWTESEEAGSPDADHGPQQPQQQKPPSPRNSVSFAEDDPLAAAFQPLDLEGDGDDEGDQWMRQFDRFSRDLAAQQSAEAKHQTHAPIPKGLSDAMEAVLDLYQQLLQGKPDACLAVMAHKLKQYWEAVQLEVNSAESNPLFVFRDGPVTTAVRQGGLLVLEDLDLPSASVSERLNSLWETEPFFNVSEDFTVNDDSGHCSLDLSVAVLPSMHIIATAHQDAGQVVSISPATRSRFTVIHVAAYTEAEMRAIFLHDITPACTDFARAQGDETAAETLALLCCSLVFSLRDMLRARHSPVLPRDMHQLSRVIRFLRNAPKDVDGGDGEDALQVMARLALVATRFFYLDELSSEQQQKVANEWWKLLPDQFAPDDTQTATPATQRVRDWWTTRDNDKRLMAIFQPPCTQNVRNQAEQPLLLLDDGRLCLNFLYGLAIRPWRPAQEEKETDEDYRKRVMTLLAERLKQCRARLQPTASTIQNMARIFACYIAETKQLLEGPPGNGSQPLISLALHIASPLRLPLTPRARCVSLLRCAAVQSPSSCRSCLTS